MGRVPFTCDFPSGPLVKLEGFNWTACDDDNGILLQTSSLTYSYHQGRRQPRVDSPTSMPALVLILLFLIHRISRAAQAREDAHFCVERQKSGGMQRCGGGQS